MLNDYRRGKWTVLSRFDWLSHSGSLNLMVFTLSYIGANLTFKFFDRILRMTTFTRNAWSFVHPSSYQFFSTCFLSHEWCDRIQLIKARFKTDPQGKFRNCGANCIVLKLTSPYCKWRKQFFTYYTKNTYLNIPFEIHVPCLLIFIFFILATNREI